MKRRPVIGLALGSGGARGWAHIGVVQALARLGIEPDVVAGTSIGALVGATVAADCFEAFAEAAERLDWLGLAKFFAEVRLPKHGLFSGAPITAWLDEPERLGGRTIGALPKPFAAVATDLYKEEAVYLTEGRVTDAVRASFSIPGVFDPVMRGGRVLVDGGLVDPVPVAAARALGAEMVIAVDINSEGARTPGEVPQERPALLTTLLQTLRMVENGVCRLTLAQRPAEVLLCPQTGFIQTLDFAGGRAGIALGEAAVEAARDRLLHLLDEDLEGANDGV